MKTKARVTQREKSGAQLQTNAGSHVLLLSLCLVAITWLVFARTVSYDFVSYDDSVYVFKNSLVQSGLTAHGIASAFTRVHAGNWHPLTTISHMLDCQLFGLKAGGHHFVNLVLHTLAVLLLFFLLREMTGATLRSAFVAAVFAIHPLRVESVAWIAERKDVLSGVFFMLTLGAYVRYARQQTPGRYALVLALFAGGLMCKPMLVTVPLVLLLLDYWPLHRFGKGRTVWRLALEKIPLLALSVASSVVTFVIQERSPGSIEQLPLPWRIENAVVSCVTYIWQMIWPANLAVFYPHPESHLAIWQVALAALLLGLITLGAVGWRARHPYFLVGWLWYLSMLLPVVGIVEVGLQGHADRYTYLPQIGLYIALTWLLADLSVSLPYRRRYLSVAAVLIVGTLTAVAWKQVGYWRNSETLWTHTLAVTRDNDVAHTNLGMVLVDRGQVDEGLAHLRTALEIRSATVHPHYDLSLALIHTNLGYALVRKGSVDDAIAHLRTAVALQPDYADAHYNLGSALSQKGVTDEAMAQWQITLSIRPNDAEAHVSLGNALVQKGALRDAISHYQAALEIAPDSVLALNNFAWLLSTCLDGSLRNGRQAVELSERAVRLSGWKNAVFLRTLAAAYAESGRFREAAEAAERARQLTEAEGDRDGTRVLRQDADLYRANTPLRDPSLSDAGGAH